MNTYYVSDTDLVAKSPEWNKTDNNPFPERIYVLEM